MDVRCERPGQEDEASRRFVLPAAFGPHDELRSGLEGRLELAVAPQVADREAAQDRGVGHRPRLRGP